MKSAQRLHIVASERKNHYAELLKTTQQSLEVLSIVTSRSATK